MSASVYLRASSSEAGSNEFATTLIFFFCSAWFTASTVFVLMSADSATIISEPFGPSLTISTFAGRIAALRIVTFFSLSFGCRYWHFASAAYWWANTQHNTIKTKRTRNLITVLQSLLLAVRYFIDSLRTARRRRTLSVSMALGASSRYFAYSLAASGFRSSFS